MIHIGINSFVLIDILSKIVFAHVVWYAQCNGQSDHMPGFGNRVLDISEMVELSGNGSVELQNRFIEHVRLVGNNGNVMLYYETDLNEFGVSQVEKLKRFLDNLATNTIIFKRIVRYFILTLRYNTTASILLNPHLDSRVIVPDNLRLLRDHVTGYHLTNKVALKYTGSDVYCPGGENYVYTGYETKIVENSKQFLRACTNCTYIVKLGYSIHRNWLDCPYFKNAMAKAEFVIVNVDFELYRNFVESYGAFKTFMNYLEQEVYYSLHGVRNDQIEKFFHLQILNSGDASKFAYSNAGGNFQVQVFDIRNYVVSIPRHVEQFIINHQQDRINNLNVHLRYKCLFENFANEWSSTGKASVILPFHNQCDDALTFSRSNSGMSLIPDISPRISEASYLVNCNVMLPVQILMENILQQGFSTVLVEEYYWNGLPVYGNVNATLCDKRGSGKLNSSMKPAEILVNIVSHYGSADAKLLFSDGDSPFGMTKHERIFHLDYLTENKKYISNALKVTGKTGVTCLQLLGEATQAVRVENLTDSDYTYYTELNEAFSMLTSNKSEIFDLCNSFVLFVDMKFENYYNHKQPIFHNNIIRDLKIRYHLAEAFVHWWRSDINVSLLLQFWPDFGDREDNVELLYCSPHAASMSEYYEAIFTWAEIFHIPLMLRDQGDLGGSGAQPISWHRLIPDQAIFGGTKNSFPLYVRRGYNTSKVFGNWTSGMHPCIVWRNELSNTKMNFLESHCGTTIRLSTSSAVKSKITDDELSTILIFSLAAFHMTEVELTSMSEITPIVQVLSTKNIRHQLSDNSVRNRDLFFSAPMSTFQDSSQLFDIVNSVAVENMSSNIRPHIHFSKLTERDNLLRFAKEILQNNASTSIQIGYESNECIDMVKLLVQPEPMNPNGRQGSQNSSLEILEHVSYVVCNFPSRKRLGFKNDMASYLETHLYLKTLLQFFYPNLKNVYFKMSPVQGVTQVELLNVLLLFDQMAHFAKAYNIQYFLLPSIASENSTQLGWWEVSNYSNLVNPDTYVDIESKFRGTDPWRPIFGEYEDKKPEVISDGNHTLWAMLVLISVVAALAIALGFVLVRMKKYAAILSDEDVQEFLRGKDSGPNSKEFNHHVNNGEYNKGYEICKSDISIERGNVLGIGNFGMVYKATLSSSFNFGEPVAVKMPLAGCDRETLKGMLREIKLLCHVGNHANLVRFIGCYTKEIQRGVLHIVMEICSGGCLLTHLRKVKADYKYKEMNAARDLFRFCWEIACGMEYIATMNLIHGDLSARNVLLNELKVCKISDFGLSRKLYQSRIYTKKSQEPLPWRWMAYESLTNLEFSTMSDVWSFGITVWEIFSLGDVPYLQNGWSKDFEKALYEGMRLSSLPLATPAVNDVLSDCCKLQPDQRPQFDDLVKVFADCLPYDSIA